MKKHKPLRPRAALWALVVLVVMASALPLARVFQAPAPASAPLPGASGEVSATHIVVDVRDDASPSDIAALNRRHNLSLAPNSPGGSGNILRGAFPAGASRDALLDKLKSDPMVEAAEPEVRVSSPESSTQMRSSSRSSAAASLPSEPLGLLRRSWRPNDAMYPRQWNFRLVGAERAWARARGEGIVVAIIDTGVAGKTTSRGQRARDFAKTEFVPGYDFVNDDADPYDDNGHGTHVAGTVAESTDNREGAAGLAPEASIMPLKVLGAGGSGSSADVAQAIRWAVDNGADVLNLSLGSSYPSEVEANAVKYARRKGALIVCAAGNGFGSPVGYPAAFPGCVAVSAVGPTGALARYSSYGPGVALAAPGGDLFSDPNGGVLQNTVWSEEDGGQGDGYYQFQGTSMAAPHVSAVAALLMSQGMHDASRVRDLLGRASSKGGPREQFGSGILSDDRATRGAEKWASSAYAKGWAWTFLALPFLWRKPRSWWRNGQWIKEQWNFGWWLRPAMLGAFWLGAFGSDHAAGWLGANSPLNLLFFSALVPFVLFWELEDAPGSRVVTALSLGVALCLAASCWGGLLSPFTHTAFGWTVWPWTLVNLAACLLIAGVAWARSEDALS